jgi:hypothetical protein
MLTHIQNNDSLVRWIILEAAIGSSLTWLDASFAFNFCYKKLADKNFNLGSGSTMEVVRMFADTVVVVHTIEKGEKDVLPLYEEAVPFESENEQSRLIYSS